MIGHYIRQTLSVTATILLLGVSLAAALALAQGTKFLSVQSGSMVPTFSRGDLVIVTSVPDDHYRVGDVITFINPNNNKQTITHRIHQILPKGSMQPQRFQTKGDANYAADQPIIGKHIIGKVNFAIPYLGFIFDFVKQPAGLLLAIYAPALSIVIAEMKRLIKYYKSQEPYIANGYNPGESVPKPSQSKRFAKAGAIASIAVVGIATPTVHAALMNTVTLESSSISSAPTNLSHLVISRVDFGVVGGGGSTTDITVTNNNPQTATSGSATVSGNGGGGSATSGNASNTSNTSINIDVGGSSGGSASGTPATVTIYNPTNTAVNLSGWTLRDNGTTQSVPNGTVVAAKGSYTFTWPVANGLSRTDDRMSLRNASAETIDALSWGSDTSQLNPPVVTSAVTTSLVRTTGVDTDTASDWTILP